MTDVAKEVVDSDAAAKTSDAADTAGSKIYAAVDDTMDSLTQGFGSPAGTPDPKTPANGAPTPEPVTPAPPPKPAADVDYNTFMKETLLWKNPVRSGIYLVSGVAALLAADYMLGHDIPLLSVIAYLTLAQMALNFLRHAIDPSLQSKATWLDSRWTAAVVEQLGSGIKTLATLHDRHLSASNPHKHLVIALSLWSVSLLVKLVAPMTLLLVLLVGAFVLPKAYDVLRPKIDPVVKDVYGKVKSKWNTADHRIKAGAIMVLILLLGCVSTIDLVVAAFVAFVFAHSQLPKEMEQLGKRVAPVLTPVGNAAAGAGSRVSDMLIGASNKFELTPTPLKTKKAQ